MDAVTTYTVAIQQKIQSDVDDYVEGLPLPEDDKLHVALSAYLGAFLTTCEANHMGNEQVKAALTHAFRQYVSGEAAATGAALPGES